MPWIAADFSESLPTPFPDMAPLKTSYSSATYTDEISQLNWIISAFNLTSAAFIPFWGQVADIFGRHWSLQATQVLMLIGSALCTGAPTSAFGLFLLGRALQGLACAGIGTLVRIVLSDRVSLEENARNWTAFTLVGGIAYGIGPVVGGYLTKANWRWCFGINLPIAFIGLIAIFLIRDEMLGPQPIPELGEHGESGQAGRRERFARRITTIDAGGQLLFLFGFGLVILGLTWAGATYDWNSAAVISTLVLGGVLVIGFLVYEYLMIPGNALAQVLSFQKPMLPWFILKNRNISLLFFVNFATGMAMYSVSHHSRSGCSTLQ